MTWEIWVTDEFAQRQHRALEDLGAFGTVVMPTVGQDDFTLVPLIEHIASSQS